MSDATGGSEPDTVTAAPPVPRAVVLGALAVLAVLVVGGLLVARGVGDDGTGTGSGADPASPLAVVTVPAPDAASPECAALAAALPETLGDAHRVDMLDPAPEGARAYRMPDGSPLVVRCGLPAPPGFVVGSALQQVSEVQWFGERDPDPTVTDSTWVAVDRARYVAVTLPEASGTGPIQDLSAVVAAHLKPVAPRPAPLPAPSGAGAQTR